MRRNTAQHWKAILARFYNEVDDAAESQGVHGRQNMPVTDLSKMYVPPGPGKPLVILQ